MPSSIFSCQTALNKDKFLEFGIKNANRAILVLTTPKVESRKKVFFSFRKNRKRWPLDVYSVCRRPSDGT